jgi:hypothetical protein
MCGLNEWRFTNQNTLRIVFAWKYIELRPEIFSASAKKYFFQCFDDFVCKLPINKIKGYLFSILSLSGPSSGSPYRVCQIIVLYRVSQIIVLIKTVSKTKCPLFYMYKVHLAWVGFELRTLMVIGTDCIGSCKSNYHTTNHMNKSGIFIGWSWFYQLITSNWVLSNVWGP